MGGRYQTNAVSLIFFLYVLRIFERLTLTVIEKQMQKPYQSSQSQSHMH